MRKPLFIDTGRKKHIANEKPVNPVWLKKNGQDKKIIHIAGMGDVGSTLLTGLKLLGELDVAELGIFDLDKNKCRRFEMEMNQVMTPKEGDSSVPVRILTWETLFQCDVFVFCIAVGVPPVSVRNTDVRMVQFAANRHIVSEYARLAASSNYKGLFVVVSDPVDLLCMEALLAVQGEEGSLSPYQIQGCGLGVMNARARYYAAKDKEFSEYLTEGRIFGPHGEGLVAANSIIPEHFSPEKTKKLTNLVVNANQEMRAIGYKPYIAPALSSGAYTILSIIRGEWNYSSNYCGEAYYGARNRTGPDGPEWEEFPLPGELQEMLRSSYRKVVKSYDSDDS